MTHLPILPVILPGLAGIILLLLTYASVSLRRALNLIATALMVVLGIVLVGVTVDNGYQVYELGNWPSPFGIVLVLDRLSAFMVLLTALVAFCSLLFAVQGFDERGKNFHPLFQLQLMGLSIAFLTGDIFNLFVAFEVLLIASYGLLLHGGGRQRVRAGLHYVIINLVGSSLFLLAVGLIYGVTGTLNMADLAVRAGDVAPTDLPLLRTGALLLFLVFAVKGALVPLYFWLPGAYSTAGAPVAALFAIMTKVGAYAIVRIYFLVFGGTAVVAPIESLLLPAALITLTLGMVGVMITPNLKRLVSYMVIGSMGTLLIAVGLFNEASLSAGLYYLAHGTVVVSALFLLAGLISQQRGRARDHLTPAQAVAQPGLLGVLFFALAVAAIGLPPLSGFLGKVSILASATDSEAIGWVWAVVLVTSVFTLVGFSRAGSVLFWKTSGAPSEPVKATTGHIVPIVGLLGLMVVMTIWGQAVLEFTDAAAAQLADRDAYIEAVMNTPRALEAQALELTMEETP